MVGSAEVESNNDPGMRLEKPAVNKIEAASPIPLPNPKRMPASIPGNACFRTTLTAVSNFVEPNEYELSFRPIGTNLMDSSIYRVMIGISSNVNAIIPTRRDDPMPK
jgi:hypothetical protein